jgi:hypothetical protein
VLTPLQQRIARLVASLPEAEGFALAGAGALVVHGYIDRQTRDLDYFTTPTRQAQVQRLGSARTRAREEGVPSQRLRDLPTFVRLVVGREPDRCEVDVSRSTTVRCRPRRPRWSRRSRPRSSRRTSAGDL